MSGLPFTKMQAIGNDFVVVEEAVWPVDSDWPAVSQRLCDRKFGIGGDGLLVVGKSPEAPVRMRMFNPDGSEDMCGNGLRCVIHYAHERGLVGTTGIAASLDGLHSFSITGDAITVAMSPPKFAPEEVPVLSRHAFDNVTVRTTEGKFPLNVVNTGSTHSVLWCDPLPDDDFFFDVSPQIEHDRLFPERTSVLWATFEPPQTVRLRIWERGVGETLGCGTGACAAAVLARACGFLDTPETTVVSKGGALRVAWSGGESDPVYLTGQAQIVYFGTWAA